MRKNDNLLMTVITAFAVMAATSMYGAVLTVGDGESVTFDTDDATYSGDHSGSGSWADDSGMWEQETGDDIAVFSFDSVDFQSGSTVDLQGSNPIAFETSGDFNLATTLDGTGDYVGGSSNGGTGTEGRLGSFEGGINYNKYGSLTNPETGDKSGYTHGQGPGGGGTHDSGNYGSGAGGGFGGDGGDGNGNDDVGTAYNDETLLQGLIGGSGGGANDNDGTSTSTDGGAGGGAIQILADGNLTITTDGKIDVTGGQGGDGDHTGAGGSGGAVWLGGSLIDIADGAEILAIGGRGGDGERTGGGGSGGRVFVEGADFLLDGASQEEGFLSSGSILSAIGGNSPTGSTGSGKDGDDGSIYYVIPEPSTLVLLGLAGLLLMKRRRL